MKLSDHDLKKALHDEQVPPPSNEGREKALQRAMDEFTRPGSGAEQKTQGFFPSLRHMGKRLLHLLTLQGGPMMTRAAFATIGVAVLALGLYFTVGTNMVYFSGQKSSPGEEPSENGIQAQVGKEQAATPPSGADKADGPAAAAPAAADKEQPGPGGPFARRQQLARQKALDKEQRSRTASKAGSEEAAEAYAMVKELEIPQASRRAPNPMAFMGPEENFESAIESSLPSKDEGRDRFPVSEANGVTLVAEQPVSTFSIDVDTASYGFVRRQLMNGVLPQKNAVRIEEMINYFDYDYSVPEERSRPFEPAVALYPTPWNENTRILHVGIKGYDMPAANRPRTNLVFLIDVSGSMHSPDKLPLLKNSLTMLVNDLAPDDTVAVVVYAGAAGTVLEPTEVRDKGKIIAALDRLQAGGSTAGGAGIDLAYSLAERNFDEEAVNRVILATDGDFNVGITNRAELQSYIEKKRAGGVFLSVLGFGQGNYNDALMQALAQHGNGVAAYIDTLNEARKVLLDEAQSTLFTIAQDVKIQVEFNPAQVHDYRLIGYETRRLNREDFNNDQVDAGDVGAGASVTALYEITPVTAKEKLVDPLRYQPEAQPAAAETEASEYAFLKIRYKLPAAEKSTLITQPVGPTQEYDRLGAVPADLRFAAAVAAFGQLLRRDPYTGDFDYDDVLALAEPARGRDPFGLRTEFLNLVRLAGSARAM